MKIPGKEIFKENKVMLVGISKDQSSFSRQVYYGFEDADIKVYPYNPNKGDYGIKVYNSYSDMECIPEVAVVLLSRKNLENEIDSLLNSGINRVIINNKACVTNEIIKKCEDKGVELNILCPLLIVGKGFHKVHKFFAGLF